MKEKAEDDTEVTGSFEQIHAQSREEISYPSIGITEISITPGSFSLTVKSRDAGRETGQIEFRSFRKGGG